MSTKLLITPTEINMYACSAIVTQLCNDCSVAEACSNVTSWSRAAILRTLNEFLSDEFFWDNEICTEHAEAIYNEMQKVAHTVQIGVNDIDVAFAEAGASDSE